MVLYLGIICGSCDDVLDKLIEAGEKGENDNGNK